MTAGFFWILLAFALFGGLHSLMASRTVKIMAERRFGVSALRYYRAAFTLIAVLTFLPVLALAARLPDKSIYTIRFPLLMLTLLIEFAGLALAAAGVQQAGALPFLGLDVFFNESGTPAKARLLTAGVYRFIRHPLYTGTLLLLWFTPRMTWNYLAFNLGATAYFIIGAYFEDKKLAEDFGAAYQAYQASTPAFLPRWKSLFK